MRLMVANIAGFLGLGSLGYGLAIWVHLGCGFVAVGVVLVLLAIRSQAE